MEALAPVAVMLLVLIVFGAVITMMVRVRKRAARTRADQAALVPLAQQHGWRYQHSDTGSADRFQGEPFPQRKHNLTVSHLVTGEFRGRSFCCFEYARRAVGAGGSGSVTDTYERFRVFAVATPAGTPTLQIKRAGLGARALDRIGAVGLTTGDADFDDSFRVTGDDTSFAHAVLTDQVRRWLQDNPRAQQWPLRFERDELVTWQPGRLTASTVPPALDFLCDTLDRVAVPSWRDPAFRASRGCWGRPAG
jgi:hypothetical protein